LRTLKLTLEYDGTNYVGWQRQPGGVSIQSLLEDALARFEGKPVTVHGAGRTDAGVHALGQVASVRMEAAHEPATVQRALNAVLPPDVRVLTVEEAPEDFHARFHSRGKTYEYRIVNAPFVSAFTYRYAWHVPGRLDVEAMRGGASMLVGRHDFAAFQGTGTEVHSTERTLTALDVIEQLLDHAPAVSRSRHRALTLRFAGEGFLRHMVRNITGTLVEVGLGRWPAEHVRTILEGRDRSRAGTSAPPAGLFLVRVHY
jgi:tRNA pseudouridine38-40 synthase